MANDFGELPLGLDDAIHTHHTVEFQECFVGDHPNFKEAIIQWTQMSTNPARAQRVVDEALKVLPLLNWRVRWTTSVFTALLPKRFATQAEAQKWADCLELCL